MNLTQTVWIREKLLLGCRCEVMLVFSFDSLFNRLKIRERDGAREKGVRAMNSYAALCKVATSMVNSSWTNRDA